MTKKKTDPWVVIHKPQAVAAAKRIGRTTAKHKFPSSSSEAPAAAARVNNKVSATGSCGDRAIDLTNDDEGDNKLLVSKEEEPVVVDLMKMDRTTSARVANNKKPPAAAAKSCLPDLHKAKSTTTTTHHNNKNNDDQLTLHKRSQFNVSASRSFYEKRSSRQARHRLALWQDTTRHDAVPLSRGSGPRGSGTASLPLERPAESDDWQSLATAVVAYARPPHRRPCARQPNKKNNHNMLSSQSSYASLMAGQVLPTTSSSKHRGSDQSRARLSEKLAGNKRRR